MVSALKTGFVLCIVGMIIAIFAVFLVPLIAGQICDLQPTVARQPPDILDNLQRGKDCAQVVAVGFLTILAVPGTLLLLVGSFIVIMAATNRISYKRFGYGIKNDWGGKVMDDRTRHVDK